MPILCTASALLKAFGGLANGFSPLALPLVNLVTVIWFTWLRDRQGAANRQGDLRYCHRALAKQEARG